MDHPRTTPTIGLYVLAVAASVLALATGLAVAMAASAVLAGSLDDVLTWPVLVWFFALFYGSVLALPLACVGVPIIHWLCRDTEEQSSQVMITGLVSLGLVLAVIGVAGTAGGSGAEAWGIGFLVGLPVAASTMIGRASVIPLVRRPKRTPARFERSNPRIGV